MVYSVQAGGRKGSLILSNKSAIVLQQGGFTLLLTFEGVVAVVPFHRVRCRSSREDSVRVTDNNKGVGARDTDGIVSAVGLTRVALPPPRVNPSTTRRHTADTIPRINPAETIPLG